MMESPTNNSWSHRTTLGLVLLLVISAALRITCTSNPYFVDSLRHVHAIESGTLIIQAPGYYLFNLSASTLAHVLHSSASHALTIENLIFGELGVLLFALLCWKRFAPTNARLLVACYAVSPIIWFCADIHSTYAAMTAFAPLLFLCCEDWNAFPLACFFWALMTGLRPSDGVFVLPWIIWQGTRRSWPTRIRAALIAVPTLLAWVIPNARRFGGFLALLQANKAQAAGLAQGILTGHPSIHSAMEVVRAAAGMLLGWGLLFPVVIYALTQAKVSRPIRSTLIWVTPGLIFFTLYYIADPIYVAYFIAPGLIAAGYLLQRWSPKARTRYYIATATASVLFMLFARPVAGQGTGSAVLNAYALKFTRWSLKHEYAPRLATLLKACGQADVLTDCPNKP